MISVLSFFTKKKNKTKQKKKKKKNRKRHVENHLKDTVVHERNFFHLAKKWLFGVKVFLKPASDPILSAVCTQVVLVHSKMLNMQK